MSSVAGPLVPNGRDVGFYILVRKVRDIESVLGFEARRGFRQLHSEIGFRRSDWRSEFRQLSCNRVIGGFNPADFVLGGAVYSYAGDGGGRVELWIFVGWDRWSRWKLPSGVEPETPSSVAIASLLAQRDKVYRTFSQPGGA